MADAPRSCAKCKKTDADVPDMKRCAKCLTTDYCSRDCQKADWKVHKKVCSQQSASASGRTNATPASSGSSGNKLKNLQGTIANPFTRLDNSTYLHDLPEEDVYKILIDAFRLRQEDNYKFEGEVAIDSIYDGSPNSLAPFGNFLQLAKKRSGLLPPWWNEAKQSECMEFGMKSGTWSELTRGIEKADIIEHYGNSTMPMQLRMLGEIVYGRGPMGQDGTEMRKMMMAKEGGEGITSILDLASGKMVL